MTDFQKLSPQELQENKQQLQERYRKFQSQNISLDMTRGKPCPEQLDLAMGLFDCVDDGHYPQEEDTTIRNRSYAVVSFAPYVSAWGLLVSGEGLGHEKLIESDAALTLYPEMDGLVIANTGASGATIHILPVAGTAHAGCRFTTFCTVAQDNGCEVGAGSGAYVDGVKHTDDKNISVDAIGDALEWIATDDHDWLVIATVDAYASIDLE